MFKHYIRLNERNDVVQVFSDAKVTPIEGDICINENGGSRPTLFGKTSFDLCEKYNPIQYSVYKYKWNGSAVVEKTYNEKYDIQEYVDALLTDKLEKVDEHTEELYNTRRFTFKDKLFSISPNAQSNWYALALSSQMGTLQDFNRVPEQNGVEYALAAADVPLFLATAFSFAKGIQEGHFDTKAALLNVVVGEDVAADRVALEAWVDNR